MNHIADIDNLIAKVLTDEATPQEQAQLKEWLQASPDNRQYFDTMQQIWDMSPDAAGALDVDVDTAWSNVQTRIHTTPKTLTVSWLSPQRWRMVAAVAVLIAALYGLYWSLSPHQLSVDTPSVIAASTVARQDTLTDGSVAELKPQSRLTTVFNKKERRVKLEGEAYFKVAPDKTKPFVVEVQTVEIKVVGTAFNVDNKSEAGKVIVSVSKGIVEVKGNNNMHRLTDGMTAIYDLTQNTFSISSPQKSTTVEIKPNLNFENQPVSLKEAVEILSKYYKTTITLVSPDLASCRVKADFSGKSLDIVLEVMGESCNFDFYKNEKGYFIKSF